MAKRIVTGVLLSLAALALCAIQGIALRLALLAFMLIGMREMYAAFSKRGAKPFRLSGYLYALSVAVIEAARDMTDIAIFDVNCGNVALLIVFFMIGAGAIVLRGKADMDSFIATTLPLLYPGLLFHLMLAMQNLANPAVTFLALTLTIFIASLNDTFALFVGMRFGKHKLSPEISPHKTVEGALGGLFAAVITGMLFTFAAVSIIEMIPSWRGMLSDIPPLWSFAILGLIGGALSQVGDLTASLVKRHFGIKDYGTIFPGHGGVMDRLDGILFCAAACYIFFNLTGLN